jgi:hypothetical protein
MWDRRRNARAVIALLVVAVASCGSNGGGGGSPTPNDPSGALGVVTLADATAAVRGLCTMRTMPISNPDAANGIFYDTVHEELHIIAAATQVKDRAAAGDLLQAKEKMESDLLEHPLPSSYPADAKALAQATRAALASIGLSVPACGS